jgi:hypothetical protein
VPNLALPLTAAQELLRSRSDLHRSGKPIHSNDEGRPFEKDEDSALGLSLRRGLNVLVVKLIHEEEDWAVSARSVDMDG